LVKPTEGLKNEHRVIERMLKLVWEGCDRLERGESLDPSLFLGAADFFRNFADRCHHAKEEKLLFEKMIERGMSRQTGPIAVMLSEHEISRAHVRKINELAQKKLAGKTKTEMVDAGRGYVQLLSQHIQKEDNVLYPMADRMLTKDDQKQLEQGFEKVENEIMGHGVHEKYHAMIEEWERKLR